MQKLAEVCIRRPVFATMLITALVVVGAYAYSQLSVDLFPKVDFPIVTVTTTLRGASPEEIETEITKKIEEAVNTISGIDEIRSISTEGVSQVFVTFLLERDVEQAAQDVRDKVSAVLRDLPQDIDPPVIEKLDPDALPVMSIAVSAGRSAREITEIADKKIKQPIESVSGVGQVRFVGDRKRQIQVWIDAEKVQAYNLTIPQIEQALAAQNVEVPGGRVDQGKRELVLRTLGRVQRAEDFSRIIIVNVDGRPIRVADIGYVEDGVEEPRTLARLDGKEAVVLQVRKQSGTNTIEVVRKVKDRLAEIQRLLPPDFRVQVLSDQSVFVRNSFEAVKEHLILGGFLAALVVLFFIRNLRSAVIAAIAIPTSIISTFALMWYMGFTLNNMTMLALVMCVGIVIDDAIVVLENIYRFIEEKGIPPIVAAKVATADIGLAVMATTFSLIIIFLPVAFMSGIIGRFMKSFGLTAAFAVGVSLIVSFTLTPMLCSRFLSPDGHKGHSSRQTKIYSLIDRSYSAMLDWSMRHRFLVALFALLIVASTIPLFQAIGKDFITQDDQSQFEVTVRAPEGLSLQATDELMRKIEEEIRKIPEVTNLMTTIGADAQRRVNLGTIFVQLKAIHEREASQQDIMERLRRSLVGYHDLRIIISPPAAIGGGGRANADVQYAINGPDLSKLSEYSEKILQIARKIPGVVDVDSSIETGKPEIRAHINRDKASDLGVSVAAIASSLRTMVGGNDQATTYREGEDRYDVQLRLMLKDRNSPETISRIYVPSTKVGNVRLDNVVTLDEGTGPAQIERYNRQRQVTITANIERGQSLGAVLATLDREVAKLNLDPEYKFGVQGRGRELGRASSNFALAFLLSFIFMYMILAAQFESFIDPVTILLSLPLSVPFAIISLFATQQNLNIFSALGILMLFGVVKKNSILQIDHIKNLRREGIDRRQAIRQGCRDRLRPILMTTFALVAGMLPMAVGAGAGANVRRSVAVVVIGGQTLCLLLTLLVTPVGYSLFDDVAQSPIWRKLFGSYQAATRWVRQKATAAFSSLWNSFGKG